MVFIASFFGVSDTHRFVIHKFVHFCHATWVCDHCPLTYEFRHETRSFSTIHWATYKSERVCGFPTPSLGAIAIRQARGSLKNTDTASIAKARRAATNGLQKATRPL